MKQLVCLLLLISLSSTANGAKPFVRKPNVVTLTNTGTIYQVHKGWDYKQSYWVLENKWQNITHYSVWYVSKRNADGLADKAGVIRIAWFEENKYEAEAFAAYKNKIAFKEWSVK